MPTYTISDVAYTKLFYHVAKHPHKTCNGVFVGRSIGPEGNVEIVDTIPLLHHWTSLSPMMEIGLDLATSHAKFEGLQLVGYYQACENIGDTSLAPVGEKVVNQIRDGFKDAVAFVIDGDVIGSGEAGLIPYLPQSAGWRPVKESTTAFAPGSSFVLASQDIAARAVALVRDTKQHQKFGDFDDHLEDVSIDWLRNVAAVGRS